MSDPRTVNDWAPETRSLLHRIIAAGGVLLRADNGEDAVEMPTVEQAIACLTATDEGWLTVRLPGENSVNHGQVSTLFLVYGNSPGELVCDYHCHPLLDAITEAHYEEWADRPQPTSLSAELMSEPDQLPWRARQAIFRAELRLAIRDAIARAHRRGAAAMGADNLWMITRIPSQYAPRGANAAWMARQVFNEIIAEDPISRYILDDKDVLKPRANPA